MVQMDFEQWLKGLDLRFWGTAQHKVSPSQFFERAQSEDAILLDVRSPQEVEYLSFPFALHIPLDELPERWEEIPSDRLVATFCSSATRAVTAWVYLQLQGLTNTRILDGHYDDLVAELIPGKIFKRSQHG